MFITPGELGVSLARAGLEVRDLSGLGPSLNPLGLGRALLHRATGRMDHDDALALVGPTPFQSLLYMGRRQPRGEADEGVAGEEWHQRGASERP